MNLELLNAISCRINDIRAGDQIPIGGSYPGRFDLTVTADPDRFTDFFKQLDKNIENIATQPGMQQWVAKNAPQFAPYEFAAMYTFDNLVRRKFPNMSQNAARRHVFYDTKIPRSLSDAFANGSCECAEIAILAQLYFEHSGHIKNSHYFGGEILRSEHDEFAEPHSFIVLTKNNTDYVYDPANPMNGADTNTYFPRIQTVHATPQQKMRFAQQLNPDTPGRKCAFLETTNIFTGGRLYYGVSDGANISPSFIISDHKNHTPTPQSER